jgi:hypothetical protein
MAAPITPISPHPFDGHTETLGAATVVVLDPQPYSNTKEVLFLNLSATDAVLVQIASLVTTPSSAQIEASGTTPPEDRTAGGLGTAWGAGGQDQFTYAGTTILATGGPRTAATDTFSVDIRAQATITVGAGLVVGDTITFNFGNGEEADALVLTAVTGPRVGGTLTFDVAGGAAAQAAEIDIAINDSIISTTGLAQVATSTVAGAVVTVTAGQRESLRGANGNSPLLDTGKAKSIVVSAQGFVGLVLASTSANLAISVFSGGVDADGGQPYDENGNSSPTTPYVNIKCSYNVNIAEALNDSSVAGVSLATAAFVSTSSSVAYVSAWALPAGSAGDGVALTENTAGALVVDAATAGGVDAVPAALAAATSTVIPAGAAVTLSIGSEGNRHPLGTDTFWAANGGSGYGIVAMTETGGPTSLNVTYINNRGYPEGV